MKNRNAMSLKAIINNIAKKNNVAAQLVLQTYMLERLLERISISKYKDNFILKGGMLISAMLGIDSRTTMDIDTTIKGFGLNEENITNNEMPTTLKIDVTTGDKITYKEVKYKFSLMLEDREINVWSYNIETILAEKFESIIKRSVLSTRIRDYYDVYMLMNTQKNNIDEKTLYDAILFTSQHRGTHDIIKDWNRVLEILKDDKIMQKHWNIYQKENFYAREIDYFNLLKSIEEIGLIFDKYNKI